jgi:hypothetical protein
MTDENEQSIPSRGSHGLDIIDRLRACETRPLIADSPDATVGGWVQLWLTLQDARVEIGRLRVALADAIRRPMGVIPESAEGLVTQGDLDAAEERRTK